MGVIKTAQTKVRGGRQRERTRTALLGAGEQLFATRSIDSITVDQIVDTAEVAKGSFYNHFADKEAFADAVYDLIQGDIEFHVYSANQESSDPAGRAARALCTVIRYAREHPDRLLATLSLGRRASAADPLNTGLASDIRHGIDSGEMSGIDVDTGILVVIGLTRAAVTHAMSTDFDGQVEQLGANVSAAALRALGVDTQAAIKIGRQAASDILASASR